MYIVTTIVDGRITTHGRVRKRRLEMSKLECEFLHCGAKDTLIVMHHFMDRDWGLCPFHENIVSKNGASIESDDGNDYLFSPVMLRGWTE